MAVSTAGQAWQRRAACRGPESSLFFPSSLAETRSDREAREATAKAICAVCPVTVECLDYALRIREPLGIWGGLNEVERREILEM